MKKYIIKYIYNDFFYLLHEHKTHQSNIRLGYFTKILKKFLMELNTERQSPKKHAIKEKKGLLQQQQIQTSKNIKLKKPMSNSL